ncbi:malonate decarboxylase acyl carrier protein [Rhodospirillum rubrum]|uniref:Malonate decarboxylase acyl carrier protein n=1 Tax=Rhodospirillum rubrum (strain ATCC 11170 / ATH 1.1.1 / DSM 467 / LMG 4362 / NCIMB 8255 / S1) TaxID=269796 RepID=Q2RUS1_RHORT|nr:malonate decarboxylase acyl carrier protein [Rhodospirillum rubrum]ABC22124.1 Malonate decarboxylase delta subunit [Rhodospirillum rubrum ATCC 11170]AEO47839.1 malonate decarboxylase delta subunit [Rhodospirillum rubrum F11]MBK1662987.1 malonate decarboxylase acyl carrier protein [Rhodospirillum rubrum]MBK1675274.1 malonate decarboxylase acyl carrier protein [Rhodospirillum rubrum]MBK5953713.1 malonate decarboxylase acyl carrier protein [Rhodospirillum rubrum]
MALNTLEFDIKHDAGTPVLKAPVHIGVVGSGDMEVLMEPKALGGAVSVRIVTPVTGFDALWKRVLEAFVTESALADVRVEINDNNATPAVVLLRLRQALAEAAGK